jgi:Cd2+/Zn2+-exporting ATPase
LPQHDNLAKPSAPAGAASTVYLIEAMDCPTEEQLIRHQLASLPGVVTLEFNLMSRKLTVYHTLSDTSTIEAALQAINMTPSSVIKQSALISKRMALHTKLFTLFSGSCALAAEMVAWSTGNDNSWLVGVLALLSILSGGLPTLKKGWIALKNLTLNIHFLMSIATIGAICIGQWPEAAMVIFLFGLAEMIEGFSLDRARKAIQSLLSMTPDTAWVKGKNGHWQETQVEAIVLHSQILVKPGERIALDGIVIQGNSTVNQAPITGESLAVPKQPDDQVFAGTLNENGSLIYTVTATQDNTTLARIIRAVENAQSQQAPTQRFVDQFSRYYTPSVVGIALLVALIAPLFFAGLWSVWIYKALVLLVIACPCALVISTPVTLVSGLAAAARHGILIKGGAYLEMGRKLTTIALDKTGTLTEGRPVLTDFILLVPDEQDWLGIAARLEAYAHHPIANAIVSAWKEKHPHAPLTSIEQLTLLNGQGVQGDIDGQQYFIGNHHLVESLALCSVELEKQLATLEASGKTVAVLCKPTQALAILAVADTVRKTSAMAMAQLHELDISPIMLTGDNTLTALAVAQTVGIEEVRGNLLPEGKLFIVETLQSAGQTVGMIGDGINDAPALAKAHIGFAMGAAGSDTAIDTADVAFMDDDLRKLPDFIRLSQRTYQLLIQNITLALTIKLVFFVLALFNYTTLWMAVFADVGASLLVIFNGLRLLGFFKKRYST